VDKEAAESETSPNERWEYFEHFHDRGRLHGGLLLVMVTSDLPVEFLDSAAIGNDRGKRELRRAV
jgi:hypothetical protein